MTDFFSVSSSKPIVELTSCFVCIYLVLCRHMGLY